MKIDNLSGVRWPLFLLILAHLPLAHLQFVNKNNNNVFQSNKLNFENLNSINDQCFCKVWGLLSDQV